MKKTPNSFLIALCILVSSGSELRAQDQVTLVNNVPGTATGLLVDGKIGTNLNDQTYLSLNNPVTIGQFINAKGQGGNEVIGFCPDRPVAIVSNVAWTAANNNVTIAFANKILIPVTIWVVYGNFDTVRTRALNSMLTASSTYSNNNVGIDFSTITFIDATANPLAPNYYIYNSSQLSTLKANIGFTSGQINIYWVNMVYLSGGGPYTNGGITNSLGGDAIVQGTGSVVTLSNHELGHAFHLEHITPYPQWFDTTNIMTQQIRLPATYLTEGQIFRMHFWSNSAINDTYNARPGKLQRNCSTSTSSTAACPSIQKRIWADSAFPAN